MELQIYSTLLRGWKMLTHPTAGQDRIHSLSHLLCYTNHVYGVSWGVLEHTKGESEEYTKVGAILEHIFFNLKR